MFQGIETPRHVYCSVDGYISSGSGNGNGTNVLKEFDDNIEVNGVTIHKPFVEKPANAEGMFQKMRRRYIVV
jgi:inositol hexakisphosphate/diphosphoinositol-pentakisphosphate kinase